MKTVDPGQILQSTDMLPKVHFYSSVLSRESVRTKFACAVPFKPGARYAQKCICTISLNRVDINPPLGGGLKSTSGEFSTRVKRNATCKCAIHFVYMVG